MPSTAWSIRVSTYSSSVVPPGDWVHVLHATLRRKARTALPNVLTPAAVLLIELDGPAAGLDEDSARVSRFCTNAGARAVRLATDPADRARLWQGRKKAFGAMGRMAPHLVVQVPLQGPATVAGTAPCGAYGHRDLREDA